MEKTPVKDLRARSEDIRRMEAGSATFAKASNSPRFLRFLRVGKPSVAHEEQSHLPPLVNFPETQKKRVAEILNKISPDGRLFAGITQVEYVETEPNNVAVASYSFTRGNPDAPRIITIYGPLNGSPEHANKIMRSLVHEMAHHSADPLMHVVSLDDGSIKLSRSGHELFGSEQNASRALNIMVRLAMQSLEMNTYVSSYQQGLGHAYHATRGLIDSEGPIASQLREDADKLKAKIDAKTATAEEMEKYKELDAAATASENTIKELHKRSNRLLLLVIEEGWAEIITKALMNRNGLKDFSDSQKKAWDEGGYGKADIAEGHDIPYLSALDGAEEVLKMIHRTDDAGLERLRAGLKSIVIPVPKTAE